MHLSKWNPPTGSSAQGLSGHPGNADNRNTFWQSSDIINDRIRGDSHSERSYQCRVSDNFLCQNPTSLPRVGGGGLKELRWSDLLARSVLCVAGRLATPILTTAYPVC